MKEIDKEIVKELHNISKQLAKITTGLQIILGTLGFVTVLIVSLVW